ncbi:SDR family oxidoreductase [Actinoallomurus sp. NBC_01490]|uniref:SDR family oxidoreductase n=1 Tax=Actinoallomurus sp. NBC_01490 TaxID=2903557 RepID=UPI002E2EEA48|nr:SDR family oxidoreductase [Actinoallomurus sp. NBC_01490]
MTEQARAALVIAASGGIGAACARELAARGYRVAVMARSEAVDTLATEIDGLAVRGDYTAPGAIEAAVARAADAFGRLEVLVNSAGHGPKGAMTELTEADYARGFELYFYNVVRSAQAALPVMRTQGGGSIVNISSSTPTEPSPMFPTSMVARAAMATWVKLWSAEAARDGVRINNVLPGFTVADPSAIPAERVSHIPLGRPAGHGDVARTVAFLASDDAAYITGQSLRVDGGSTRSV